LAVRIGPWHSAQKLTLSNLRSGFLSTFRLTLLALTQLPYDNKGAQKLNQFMDTLSVAWSPTKSYDDAEAIEFQELNGSFHYLLNISGNRCQELAKYREFLSGRRGAYKRRYLPPGTNGGRGGPKEAEILKAELASKEAEIAALKAEIAKLPPRK
jgi:hypothetical protein